MGREGRDGDSWGGGGEGRFKGERGKRERPCPRFAPFFLFFLALSICASDKPKSFSLSASIDKNEFKPSPWQEHRNRTPER